MNTPLISIVVPIYNAEAFLEKCIQSLINQEYSNIQIILVNDGSQDDSLKICYKFEKMDSRVVVIDQKNQGVSAARSAGIKVAKGEYIGFVDSDDFIYPTMYKFLLDKMLAEDSQCATLINFTVKPVAQDVLKIRGPITNLKAIGELFLLQFPTSMWAYLYKTELVNKVNLSDDIHFFEDFEFNYNYLKLCEKVSVCQGVLYSYNSNPQSVNQQEINVKKISCLKIYAKLVSDIARFNSKELSDRAVFFRAHFIVSMLLSFSASIKESKVFFLTCFRENISDLGWRFYLSSYVPLSYKVVILSFYINPYIAERLVRFFKGFK